MTSSAVFDSFQVGKPSVTEEGAILPTLEKVRSAYGF
jgi:hypothetical protein